MENISEEGFFQSKLEIPERWGDKGTGKLMWLLYDTPVLIYALQKFGVDNKQVREATRLLIWLSENNGWRCIGSNPKFRGPGKKEDHCPYANLITLKALSLSNYKDKEAVQNGTDSNILPWGKRDRIYMFGEGADFRKLKYHNILYDILHVIDVLSRYSYVQEYDEFWQIWSLLRKKQQLEGGFLPESI